MPEATREEALRRLGDAMSDVSEECWHAGWEQTTEHALPELCRRAAESGEPQPWGQSLVTPSQARELIELARRAGSWADIDERGIGYVPFEPWPVPKRILGDLDREKQFAAEKRAPEPPRRLRRAGSPSVTEYIVAHYHHLMTDLEKLAYKKLLVEQKAIGASPRLGNALRERLRDASGEVESALTSGPDAFLARVAERVLREHPDEVLLNRCPRCRALCRTPRAKLCPECHHTWHSEAAV